MYRYFSGYVEATGCYLKSHQIVFKGAVCNKWPPLELLLKKIWGNILELLAALLTQLAAKVSSSGPNGELKMVLQDRCMCETFFFTKNLTYAPLRSTDLRFHNKMTQTITTVSR